MLRCRLLVAVVLVLTAHASSLAQTEEIPLADVMIRLDRSGCFGSCPVYTVTIHGDGHVAFEGRRFTAHEGPAEWTIAPDAVLDLLNRFLDAQFFTAAPRYDGTDQVAFGSGGNLILTHLRPVDLPAATLTLQLGEREHTVVMQAGIPEGLRDLAGAVDEVARTAPYVES